MGEAKILVSSLPFHRGYTEGGLCEGEALTGRSTLAQSFTVQGLLTHHPAGAGGMGAQVNGIMSPSCSLRPDEASGPALPVNQDLKRSQMCLCKNALTFNFGYNACKHKGCCKNTSKGHGPGPLFREEFSWQIYGQRAQLYQ